MNQPPSDSARQAEASETSAGVLSAIEAAKQEILDLIRETPRDRSQEIPVADADLRDAIEWLQKRIPRVIAEAQADARLELNLDDLFDLALKLTRFARAVDAVDLEVIRWQDDDRMRRYFATHLQAMRDGCHVRRIYVISPNVKEVDVPQAEWTIGRHLESNDDDQVRDSGGQLELAVIHHSEIRDQNFKDFAILDGDKAMVEDFNRSWTTTFRGRLTKDSLDVSDYQVYFDRLWGQSMKLRSRNDVESWADELRTTLMHNEFEHDVFLGYADDASAIALAVREFLRDSGFSFKDWKDFSKGSLLLEELEDACRACRLGLFLFTSEDERSDGDTTPRDNVIFEAGYFLSRKGHGRVLVIAEAGVTMPSDLLGSITVELEDRNDPRTIHTELRNWLEENLTTRSRR
jgi:predicted nucleotide-binding protein